jgi:hypothetical protein
LRGTKQTKVFWFYFSKKNMLSLPVLLAACAHPAIDDQHVPPFARAGWAPFSRDAAVAIALREWRLFGQKVDDDPPGTRPEPAPDDKPERQAGLWQRVGEYWWIGQDPGEREVAWTGMHDERGTVFEAAHDATFAWSAAFVSYVMRIAGAGGDFPYSPNHSTYINAAVSRTTKVLQALPPQSGVPAPGDIVCMGRGQAAGLRFSELPTASSFPAHCDIVVGRAPGVLEVIGGNVDDAVTMKHVPVAGDGRLVGPDGHVLDSRYPWMVVLKVLYAR